MSGFTLGGQGGATLGEPTGGTLGSRPDIYRIDGQRIGDVRSEQATHRTLTLQIRAPTARVENVLRDLKPDEGKVDDIGADDGGFRAVDRANGSNTFEIRSPAAREPLRADGTYHVLRYEEDLVSQTVNEWDVEIELLRDRDRVETPDDVFIPIGIQPNSRTRPAAGATLGETAGFTLGGSAGATLGNDVRFGVRQDFWGLDTRYGTLVTDRVDADVLGTGEGAVERFELTLRLTKRQAWTFESAYSRVGGSRVRDIPDGDNVVVDDTEGSVNTVGVDTPDDQTVVGSGDYVVIEWEARRLTDAFWSYDVVIARQV